MERNVQTVAAATEELSISIREIASQVMQSSQISERAVVDAQRTNQTVQMLAASAEKIGHVVQLISTIASQTNLLALNATIEAARRCSHLGVVQQKVERTEIAYLSVDH